MRSLPAGLLIFATLLASCAEFKPADGRAAASARKPTREPRIESAPSSVAAPAIPVTNATPLIACAGSAARDSDNKIDVDATIAALGKVGCNAYLYDLPAGSDAWARLPRFVDAAKRQGIDTYVYLEPFTLAKKNGEDRQDGPFSTGYGSWCKAIGKLAVDHPGIAGVVMDDFASNVAEGRFDVDYVTQMRANLRAAGRPLRWLPVLYFDLPLNETLTRFGPVFGDGAILAYPRAGRELDAANLTLHDQPRGASFGTTTPKRKLLKVGQGTFARATLTAEQARRASRLTFFVNDQNATDRRGRHRLVARIDGRTVWEHEVADENYAESVSVPLRSFGGTSEIQVGVLADETSADEVAIVHVAFDDVSVRLGDGTRMNGVKWREGLEDGLDIGIVPPRDADAQPRWHVPMTLLLAGAPFEHAKRYNEPGTPAAIAGRVGNAIDWMRAGKTDGLVLWFLPLDSSTTSRALVDAVAEKTSAGPPARR